MKQFFSSFIPNIVNSFRGKNKWLHISAIALTFIIVVTGIDWLYFAYMYEGGRAHVTSAVIVGGLIPIVLPLTLIIAGLLLDAKYHRRYGLYGAALAQAVILGSLISSAYKAFTGRVQPMLSDLTIQSSYDWNFGFWEHGVFWGWPSSHTTIAFSMAFCLVYLSGKHKVVSTLAVTYAFWIGIGVTYRIHWFSEFVAGAFIGAAIGATVGSFWRSKVSTK